MEIIKGNIFTTKCQTIVNAVNCVGVMGAGLAFEFRLRYPEMFTKYKELTEKNLLNIGSLWIYKVNNERWILNFPTKFHWKYPSKIEYIEKGLQKFVDTYKGRGITSIAFPLLGASNGGLNENQVLEVMNEYLQPVDIPVEIYKYDTYAYDDLYLEFKKLFSLIDESSLAKQTGLRIDIVRKLKKALNENGINSLSKLLTIQGIGDITLEKSFNFIMKSNQTYNSLF